MHNDKLKVNSLVDLMANLASNEGRENNHSLMSIVTQYELPREAILAAGTAYSAKGLYNLAIGLYAVAGSEYDDERNEARELAEMVSFAKPFY